MASFENLQWTLIAEDKASGTFKKVALSAREISDASDDLNSKLNQQSSSWQNIAKGVFAGGVALGAAKQAFGFLTDQLALSVQEAGNFQREQAQLNAVLQSTQGIAGLTAQELNAMGEELASATAIAGGDITNVQSMLLTFTKIGEDNFVRVTEAVLDLATAMNSGGIPSTEQLKSTAIQLGKAMNDPIQGVSALSKAGVQLSDSQKELIETLMDTNDVAGAQQVILDELATQTGGSASAAAQTYEGRMAKLNEAINQVRETVGMALMPTLSVFVDTVIDQTGKVKLSEDGLRKWQKGIYDTAQAIRIMAIAVGGVIGVAVKFANLIVQVEQVVLGVFTDMVRAAINLEDTYKNLFKAIGKALTGDFSGAWDTLKDHVSTTFKYTIREGIDVGNAFYDLGASVLDAGKAVGDAITQAADHSSFDKMVDSMNSAGTAAGNYAGVLDDASGSGGKMSEAQEKLQDSVEKLQTDYTSAREKIAGEVLRLEESHNESVDKIKDKLEDLQVTLLETTTAYQEAMGELNKTEAERVIEQEQNISEMQARLSELKNSGGEDGLSTDDQAQIDILEAQIARETAAYQEYIDERKGLDAELTEARRRAALTDFERSIEDINDKRAEEQAAYDARIVEIQGEVLAQQDALAEEQVVYEAKMAMYAEVDAAFQAFHDSYLANLESMGAYTADTVATMEAELARITKLFSEIKELRASAGLAGISISAPGGGSEASGSAAGDQSVTTQVTINVTGNTLASQSDITTLVNEITRQLELAGLASS